MTAPIQSTVGKTSTAPATQDYLNELNLFYAKPENEGVQSEFTAPDGSKYKISDASYLSTVRTNVDTGKFDAKAEANNKELSKDADTSVGSYAADKKAAADKQQSNGPTVSDAKAAEAEGAESKKSSGNLISQSENVKTSSTSQIDATKAQEPNLEAKLTQTEAHIAENKAATKETFAKMEADNGKMDKLSKAIVVATEQKFHQAVAKRKAKIEKEKAKAEANAEAASEGDSTQQSGAKMGFGGKLMTTAPASTGSAGNAGNAAQEKAWEDTMNGKLTTQSKVIATEVPQLENVKEAGAKAAQPLLDQADASKTSAANQETSRHNAVVNGESQYLGEGFQMGAGVAGCVTGGITIASGCGANIPPPFTSGIPLIVAGVAQVLSGLTTIGLGIKGAVDNVGSMRTTARACEKQHDSFLATASTQETQSMVARRGAIVQAQADNVKIIKATQALNKASQEMSQGLSSSSLPGINTDGMDKDQLETVKQDRYNQIMAHEQQHASIIGGSPVIETDSNGVAVGGYVQIDVPSLNESDLEGTIEKAQKVVDAALAPSDPSSQDQSIASQAKDVLSKAQDMLAEKTEKAKAEEDKKPEEKKDDEVKDVTKTEVKEDETKQDVKENKNEAKKAA